MSSLTLRTLVAGLLLSATGAAAQSTQPTEPPAAPAAPAAESAPVEEPASSYFDTTTVTASGREQDVFDVATPVTVIPQLEIERKLPENAADLLRDQPGVDVNGVGSNQARPVIRGQRGLRVLFLEDGLRLNNARRQTDFGEISGLVDVDDVASVEVVRGPMSVLYGSDAIGGVLNLVTRPAALADGRAIAGSADFRFGTAGDMSRAQASVTTRIGGARLLLSAAHRDGGDYDSADGSYGDIDLADPARVVDTGVQDDSLFAVLSFDFAERHNLTLRHRRYSAGETGFGFVDPADFGVEEDTRIRITYPFQDYDRSTLAYVGSALGLAIADTIDAQLYFQNNERELENLIDINIGPIFPGAPNSSVVINTVNFSDLETWGLRGQAIKVAGDNHLLTYGVEGFQDDSRNTDDSRTTTTIRFPFPPFQVSQVDTDTVPNAPNAENTSFGLFLQDEISLGQRFKLVAGARYQKVETQAKETPGWDVSGLDFSDDNLVGAVNLLFQATDYLNVLASYGTAFRAPNIIERLFNGPTPEGAGFQILNPDLKSETGENYDLGIKYRRNNAFMEVVYFQSDLDDGIIQDFLSEEEIAALPPDVQDEIAASGASYVVQQRNIDRLEYEGVEVALGYRTPWNLAFGGNYTYLSGKRIAQAAVPVDDQYSDKINAYVRYEAQNGRWWAEYHVRHNGSQEVELEPGEPAPAVGTSLPAFTVHGLGAGVTLFQDGALSHQITLGIENLTDELYAEFSNATFFRPEPGRNITASYRIKF